jgi:uncharacterized protein
VKFILIALIRFYKRFFSPLFPPSCRFIPTCSTYAETAVERFGIFKGTYLSIKRILKCHPFHPGGFDPVPDKENKNG